jgi:hypothetical protein
MEIIPLVKNSEPVAAALRRRSTNGFVPETWPRTDARRLAKHLYSAIARVTQQAVGTQLSVGVIISGQDRMSSFLPLAERKFSGFVRGGP